MASHIAKQNDTAGLFQMMEVLKIHYRTCGYFEDRDYPSSVIDCAFQKALQISQEVALTLFPSKNNDNVIPFVSTYNASLPNIGNIIHKYWDLFKLCKSTSVQYVYILAYKRAKNI
jgi:hypothetical protein